MPKNFTSCVKGGGKVRTVKPNKESYMHVCIKNNKSVAGEVKKSKTKSKKRGR